MERLWIRIRRNLSRLPLEVLVYVSMVVALAAVAIGVYLSPPSSSGSFTILQINDLYKVEGLERGSVGGLARVRTLRAALEKEKKPVLTLHAGDFLYPSVASKYLKARQMIRCMNLLDGKPGEFDDRMVVTFGNHEFDDDSRDLLAARILESDFHWVASTLRFRWDEEAPFEAPSKKLGNVKDDLVLDLGGVKVGILGVTLEDEKLPWVEYRYADPAQRYQVIGEALQRLQEKGAQVLIALTHQGIEQDIELARKFPQIHLIVGGHDHTYIHRPEGKTLITKADADARSVWTIDVEVLGDGRVVAVPRRIELGFATARDGGMMKAVNKSRQDLEAVYLATRGNKMTDKLGSSETLLEGVETAIRERETAMGNYLADAIRQEMKTQVTLLNAGSVRINDNIPAGQITWEDLEGIAYFDNTLVSFSLSPEQILSLLQSSVSKIGQADGGFLQVSGLRFRYHIDRSADGLAYKVDWGDVRICPKSDGCTESELKALEPGGGAITVSALNYLCENISKGESSVKCSANGPTWREVVEGALRNGGKPIAPKVEGRITRVDS